MKKKVLALLLGTCMAVSLLAGCGSSGGSDSSEESAETSAEAGDDKEGYNFEIIVKSYQSSYWQAAVQGINQEAEKVGASVNCTGPNQESDIADQVNMLNNAINNKPDGIGLAACDQDAVLDALQTAMDKQIPVVCFDSGVPNAPEGSVYSTIATDNYGAGATAAEHLYEGLKDKISKASSPVRIGEVNQDATSESLISRGLGFIDKFIELASADGKKVAVEGNDYFVSNCKGASDKDSADIIIDVAVPAQTTQELCATEASNLLNKSDLIGIFGSNQIAAEGILNANENLKVLGSNPDSDILAVGFDAGTTIKTAVAEGIMYGAVAQSPLAMGIKTIDVLCAIADGETVEDVQTEGDWYDASNMDDEAIAPNLYD